MAIIIFILITGGLFFFLYRIIDLADHFFCSKKSKPYTPSISGSLPDDGAGEYIDNFYKFTKN